MVGGGGIVETYAAHRTVSTVRPRGNTCIDAGGDMCVCQVEAVLESIELQACPYQKERACGDVDIAITYLAGKGMP